MASGYVGNCQTYPIKHGTDELCSSCSFCTFVSKRCDRDDRWNFYKGRIISKHQPPRKILVKSLRDHVALSSTECHAEVQKLRFAKKVASQNPQLKVEVLATYCAEIDEVSVSCGGASGGEVQEGMQVVVQERTKERIEDFRPLGANTHRGHDPYSHPHLLEFVRAAYRSSEGRYVISGLKGFKESKSGSTTYLLTSITVHSERKEFGVTDRGQDGFSSFLSCGGLHDIDIPRNRSLSSVTNRSDSSLQRLEPSAPQQEEATGNDPVPQTHKSAARGGQHLTLACNRVVAMDAQDVGMTPPPAYELSWSRRRHKSAPLSLDPPPEYPDPETHLV